MGVLCTKCASYHLPSPCRFPANHRVHCGRPGHLPDSCIPDPMPTPEISAAQARSVLADANAMGEAGMATMPTAYKVAVAAARSFLDSLAAIERRGEGRPPPPPGLAGQRVSMAAGRRRRRRKAAKRAAARAAVAAPAKKGDGDGGGEEGKNGDAEGNGE